MQLAFDPKYGDFSGITSAARLSISPVKHKAYVAVDEKGSEAAAATALVSVEMSGVIPSAPPVVFRADHPFVFFICDNRSGSILFLGRVSDLSKE